MPIVMLAARGVSRAKAREEPLAAGAERAVGIRRAVEPSGEPLAGAPKAQIPKAGGPTWLVPAAGLEPAVGEPCAPQTYVSTNSPTTARSSTGRDCPPAPWPEGARADPGRRARPCRHPSRAPAGPERRPPERLLARPEAEPRAWGRRRSS